MRYFFNVLVLIICSSFYSCSKKKDILFPDVKMTIPEDLPIRIIGDAVDLNVDSLTQELFFPSAGNRGYCYGSAIALNDSVLLMSCTRFKNFGDFNESHIVCKWSYNRGKTWSEETVLQENIGLVNTGPPCLLKISEKHIMMFFSVKNSNTDIDLFSKESTNGGKEWGSAQKVNKLKGYNILNNDRVVYSNGRIILPIAYSRNIFTQADQQVLMSLYSDDLGKTWTQSNIIRTNFGLTEPAICPTGNNGMLMAIRTLKGMIYFTRSNDNGATWTGLFRSGIISPEAPQALLRVNNSDTLLLIWNFNKGNGTDDHDDRSPLTIAYSIDKGMTWNKPINIQWNRQFNYFYPSIYLKNNNLHITYGVRRKRTYEPSVFHSCLNIKELFH